MRLEHLLQRIASDSEYAKQPAKHALVVWENDAGIGMIVEPCGPTCNEAEQEAFLATVAAKCFSTEPDIDTTEDVPFVTLNHTGH